MFDQLSPLYLYLRMRAETEHAPMQPDVAASDPVLDRLDAILEAVQATARRPVPKVS